MIMYEPDEGQRSNLLTPSNLNAKAPRSAQNTKEAHYPTHNPFDAIWGDLEVEA